MDSRQRFVNPPSAAKKAGELPPRLAMRTAEATDCESAPGDSLWAGSGHSLGSPVNASIMLAPMPERILVAQTNERPGRKERALLGSHTESENKKRRGKKGASLVGNPHGERNGDLRPLSDGGNKLYRE